MDGDGVADMIVCQNPSLDPNGFNGSPGNPVWSVHLWDPSIANFNPTPHQLPVANLSCIFGSKTVYVVDVDGAPGAEILFPAEGRPPLGSAAFYTAFRWDRVANTFVPSEIRLPTQWSFFGTGEDNDSHWELAPIHFLDVNGDGLSDAVYTNLTTRCSDINSTCFYKPQTIPASGFSGDTPVLSVNNGKTFGAASGVLQDPWPAYPADFQGMDYYGANALPMDVNGDGRMDLLIPMPNGCGPKARQPAGTPCWYALLASPAEQGFYPPPTAQGQLVAKSPGLADSYMTLMGTFPGTNGDFVIPAPYQQTTTDGDPADFLLSWTLLQVTDVDGDGRQDIVQPTLDANANAISFTVIRGHGAADLLVSVSDGLNPLSPGSPGFVPTVSIGYGNLVDNGAPAISPDAAFNQNQPYLSRANLQQNDCLYPRSCVVGPDRVVHDYQLNNGANFARSFEVRYRNGRYDRLGRGFLGFEERIVLDLDRSSGTAEFYDNTQTRYDPTYRVYPFAGRAYAMWSWSPADANLLTSPLVDLHYSQTFFQQVPSTPGSNPDVYPGTYFVLPASSQVSHDEGTYMYDPVNTLLDYVEASATAPSVVLSHVTTLVTSYDLYGNVLGQVTKADGVDQTDTIARSNIINDTDHWLIGLVQDESACSTALSMRQCRSTHKMFDGFGEVTTQQIGDPGDAGTQLTTGLTYDAAGQVVRATFDDALGHHREMCVSYDPSEVFPYAMRNTLGHTSTSVYHPGLGVRLASSDPNGLVTQWAYDGFGRPIEELRPDHTYTLHGYERTNKGTPQGWWATRVSSEVQAGPLTATTLDGALRPVEVRKAVSAVTACGASGRQPGLTTVEEQTYDRFGRLTRATTPWLEGDALANRYFDRYGYDNIGRVTSHTDAWGRNTSFTYDNNVTYATDWLGTSSAQFDALGRTVAVVDKITTTTTTTYGPFSLPWTVTRSFPFFLASETTQLARDAYGRVITENDVDRGLTTSTYDGFGEVATVSDALGREFSFNYDGIGRLVRRDDAVPLAPGGLIQLFLTEWTFDTAQHGIGLPATVTSPDGHEDRYFYDLLSRPTGHLLTFGDTGETFGSAVQYDNLGRVVLVAYPRAKGVPELIVQRGYDAFSNLIEVRDTASMTPYWQLNATDGAGRPTEETLGNGVKTTRSYSAKTGLVERIQSVPRAGGKFLQDTTYGYDLGLRMRYRTQPSTEVDRLYEVFQHDAVDRLICAQFSAQAPTDVPSLCGDPIVYSPNGNILHKPGVGSYIYDPNHTHAVSATAGAGAPQAFKYDAVGNQTSRPGAPDITYTPFDLPARFSGGADVVDIAYDGNQNRIRKTADLQETVYFDDLYERVTSAAAGVTHKFYVPAGSSTVVVTASVPGTTSTAYVLKDALGSTDVLTDENGGRIERRSYDAFGAQRNPTWGSKVPYPANFVTPMGYTGQEGDDDLGLVNMRGRLYDPHTARFMSTDPIVHNPHNTQAWNRFSYVWNSPLNFVDPTGFDGERWSATETPDPSTGLGLTITAPSKAKVDAAPAGGRTGTHDAAQDDAQNVRPDPAPGPGAAVLSPEDRARARGERPPQSVRHAAAQAGAWNGLVDQAIDLAVFPVHDDVFYRAFVAPHVDPVIQSVRAAEPPSDRTSFYDRNVREEYDFTHGGVTFLTAAILAVLPVGEIAASVRGARAAEGAVATGPRATLELALEVQGNVPRGVQTVSILETAQGRTLVGGGVMDLRPDQIARAVARGLEPVAAPGLHAEHTVLQGAYLRGLTPRAGVATNNVCAGRCAPLVRDLGGWVLDKWYGF